MSEHRPQRVLSTIYLDHNASTPPFPSVIEVVASSLRNVFGNPSSQHVFGRQARKILESARDSIAADLGLNLPCGDRLIFSSGATEANHLALAGLSRANAVVVSPLEHPSVFGAVTPAESSLAQSWQWPVDTNGTLRVDALAERLKSGGIHAVACSLASGETGAEQPIAEISRVCAEYGAALHLDATQSVGKTPIDFHGLGCASMTFGAHKFGGPRGVGGLAIRAGAQPPLPLLRGGFQEYELRAGTESPALAAGMAEALRIWQSTRAEASGRMGCLRNRLEREVTAACPGSFIHSASVNDVSRLPHTSNIAFPNVDGAMLLMQLDLAGIACSIGSACRSGSLEPSPALLAMGVSKDMARSSVRFSLGYFTSEDEITLAIQRIVNVVRGQ